MYPRHFTGLGISTGEEIPDDAVIQLEVDRVQCRRNGGSWDGRRCTYPVSERRVVSEPVVVADPTTCPDGFFLTEFGSCRPVPYEPPEAEPEPYVPVPDPEPWVPEPEVFEPEIDYFAQDCRANGGTVLNEGTRSQSCEYPPGPDEPEVIVADPETGEPVTVTVAAAQEAEANGEVVQYFGPPASGGGGGYAGSTRVTVRGPTAARPDAAALLRKWLPVGAAVLLLMRGGSS